MLLEITGNPNVGFNEEDIEGDFDPKKYDEAMQVSNSYKYDIFPIISCFTYGTRKALLCFWISIIKMSRPFRYFLTFDCDQLAKIHENGWRERLNIS